MQIFYWFALVMVVGLVIFFVQNSLAPALTLRFFTWQIETSFIYVLLGAIGWGIFFILFLWIPTAVRGSLRARRLKKDVKFLKEEMKCQGAEEPEGIDSGSSR